MSCSKKLGFLIWFDSIEGNVAVVACVVGLLGKPALKEAKFQKISAFKNFFFHVHEFWLLHESCQLTFEIGVENWIMVFFLSFQLWWKSDLKGKNTYEGCLKLKFWNQSKFDCNQKIKPIQYSTIISTFNVLSKWHNAYIYLNWNPRQSNLKFGQISPWIFCYLLISRILLSLFATNLQLKKSTIILFFFLEKAKINHNKNSWNKQNLWNHLMSRSLVLLKTSFQI